MQKIQEEKKIITNSYVLMFTLNCRNNGKKEQKNKKMIFHETNVQNVCDKNNILCI